MDLGHLLCFLGVWRESGRDREHRSLGVSVLQPRNCMRERDVSGRTYCSCWTLASPLGWFRYFKRGREEQNLGRRAADQAVEQI